MVVQLNSPKRAVVTGGAGFIGSHLVEALADKGYQVTILDNLSSGKISNVESFLGEGRADLVQGSITNLGLLESLFKGADYVFHLAALPSVPGSVHDPAASHEANATGTLNALLAARDNNVKKFVLASSCAVYGDTPTMPLKEDMLPNPGSPYAVTKLVGEYYCDVFRKIYRVQTACLRYFNVYGPRQDPNSQYAAAIPAFIRKVLDGNPPVIFGDGEQTRDFIFVKDVARANVMVSESDACGIFNIGFGVSTSINKLTRAIAKIAGSDLSPVYQAPRAGDILHSLGDVSKAMSFGFSPKYSLEQGISETIKWLKNS